MNAPDYFPPDYTHTLLPIDAQMMLRDAHAKPAKHRIDSIDKAVGLIRAAWPGCFRLDEQE